MFTGLITAIGRIETVTPLGDNTAGVQLTINMGTPFNGLACGQSIAVQGACMTVIAIDGPRLMVEVSRTSLHCTVGLDTCGEVNLEKALSAGDPLGGHFVTGHIDGIGTVTHFSCIAESYELRVLAPHHIGPMLANKGSLAVNGVSLTTNTVEDRPDGCECSINLIPYTLAMTTLKYLTVGAQVNLEVDLIARYLSRIMDTR